MSHVSISRSYAVLAGLEGYIKATSKVRSAAQAAKQEMDRLLHADKVQQEKEAKMGKSQSAKLERQHLAAVKAEQEKVGRSKKSIDARLSRVVGRFKGGKEMDSGSPNGTRRRPEGLEDGDPAPEGNDEF